ncbi:type IV pilus biogenesis protein PilM [Desulfitobacterium sp.]|uniref:type IV pilus biogenesis protein PilM n=1 Tax=Desulfitobacterium sp. TaxID=49981 RepID=UPI002B1F3622|nr:pilus assembly protein PilM [Desulfitobacterium sp.]MEA4900449.1 pilus assembly protein PilM [Desulfitobacterium sp.]
MKTKWVALVRGNRWVAAKVRVVRRNVSLKILALSEYDQNEEESPVSNVLQLRTWLKKEKIPLKKLQLTLSCPGVITRMITLPLLPAKDLDKLLTEQAAQYFTVNIDDYLVDYRIVEKIEEEGQKRLKVLVTALPKSQWEPLWNMWQEIGLEPKVVDLASDCLARLYSRLNSRNLKKEAGEQPKDMAIVDLNSDGVEFLLLEHGVFFLYSDMEADLTGLPDNPVNQVDQAQQTQQAQQAQQVQLEFAERFNPVLRTLAEFLSFFAMRHFGKNVDEIYLTGEMASLPSLPELFESELEIPTCPGFVDDWKPSYSKNVDHPDKSWVKYGSLYGLAIRED